jgi:hypothetical protein
MRLSYFAIMIAALLSIGGYVAATRAPFAMGGQGLAYRDAETVIGAPIDVVRERLSVLDMGDHVDEPLWQNWLGGLARVDAAQQVVRWPLGKLPGLAVVARLSPESKDTTRIRLDIDVPPEAPGDLAMAITGPGGTGLRAMYRERILSFLGDRAFDGDRMMAEMYGDRVDPETRKSIKYAMEMQASEMREAAHRPSE